MPFALGLRPAGKTLSMLLYVISLGGGKRLIKLIREGISTWPPSISSPMVAFDKTVGSRFQLPLPPAGLSCGGGSLYPFEYRALSKGDDSVGLGSRGVAALDEVVTGIDDEVM